MFAWRLDDADLVQVTSFVAFVSMVWLVVGYLKEHRGLITGDARKINHACALAGGVLWFQTGDSDSDRASCHLAVGILFAVLLVCCSWRHAPVIRYVLVGYARDSDRPHEAFHVWFSWLVTIAGLELVDLLFASLPITRCATLVLGLADAIAEPIGTRFGVHRYAVRDVLTAAPRSRSWEGSLSVAVVTVAVILVSAPSLGWSTPAVVWGWAMAIGGCVALVEAWTPHGLDNFTIPVTAAILIALPLHGAI